MPPIGGKRETSAPAMKQTTASDGQQPRMRDALLQAGPDHRRRPHARRFERRLQRGEQREDRSDGDAEGDHARRERHRLRLRS